MNTLDYVKESINIKEDYDVIKNQTLNESSFSRTLSHMNNRECMFITAFRNEFSTKENLKRNKSLKDDLEYSGLGFVSCKGGFIENRGSEIEREVIENSYFVINTKFAPQDFVDLAINLCKKYNQDSVLVTFPPTKGWTTKITSRYYDKDGNVDTEFSGISLNNIEEYFTKIGGKKFKFESFDTDKLAVLSEELNNLEFRDVYSSNGRRLAQKDFKNKYGTSNALSTEYRKQKMR